MPSIPQSLLWISLVVLWLFVLVPMLISKREAVRRTSDVALATRVLTSGNSARLLRRGPAGGHPTDPDWRPPRDEYDEDEDDYGDQADERVSTRRVVVAAQVRVEEYVVDGRGGNDGIDGRSELDVIDVDVVEEPAGELPAAAAEPAEPEPVAEDGAEVPVAEAESVDEGIAEDADEGIAEDTDEGAAGAPVAEDAVEAGEESDDEPDTRDEYEYVEDSSGLEEAPAEEALRPAGVTTASRRRRHESERAAAIAERKYRFRTRMVCSLGIAMLVSAVVGFFVVDWAWWLCGVTGTMLVLYLAYLRRQTRIEEQLRRRRAQRAARPRAGVGRFGDPDDDRDFERVSARMRRPGAAVLDIDDEDPCFEHLDTVRFAREFDLPRAAGQ